MMSLKTSKVLRLPVGEFARRDWLISRIRENVRGSIFIGEGRGEEEGRGEVKSIIDEEGRGVE